MEPTTWAVIQHVNPYHPEDDKTRTSTEVILWIFATQGEAARYKATYLLRRTNFNLEVRKVHEESWDTKYGPKKKEKADA